MTSIVLSDVTLNGDTRPRLDQVSLSIGSWNPSADVRHFRTAIVGFSGAGKTSLLNVISGFELPSSGTLDHRRDDSSRDSQRLPLYWVPQNGGLWNHMTLDQHLAVVECSSEGRETILKQMDLIDRRHAYPSELSQGERSRAAVARALSTNAALLVMDEPLCHVDPVRKSSYWNVITKRLEEQGTALIFSSHEPETVLGWSSDVVCLHEGKVLHHGKTRALYDGPPSEQTGRLLGPLNWFSQEECLIFLDLPIATRHGLPVRPENITVEATGLNDSSLEIVATHFSGGYSQSIIRHRETGKLCSVTHRSGTAIRAGSLVKLNLIRHDSLSCSEFA